MIKVLKLRTAPWWLPSFCWCALIFWLSGRSQIEPPDIPLPPHADKLVHFVLYAVLSHLFRLALIRSGVPARSSAVWSMILAAVYGVTDEFHQFHVPGRNADIIDWVADLAGASTSLISSRFTKAQKPKHLA